MAEHLIGTSGWHYEHWRGPFYPTGLAKTRWLEIVALGVAKAYIYFNNDAQAFAVRNALTLARVLGQTSPGSSPAPG